MRIRRQTALYRHHNLALRARSKKSTALRRRGWWKSKTLLGSLRVQWPGFELKLLGKLLRQEVLQTARLFNIRLKFKSHIVYCQVFFPVLLAGCHHQLVSQTSFAITETTEMSRGVLQQGSDHSASANFLLQKTMKSLTSCCSSALRASL